jgi:hypothetical protein
MTDIEQKALALVNEVARELGWGETKEIFAAGYTRNEALFRAIEQHEAFRQEVSDAVEAYLKWCDECFIAKWDGFDRFVIPKPKPDPLVEIISEINAGPYIETKAEYADCIRAALDAAGFEIREKNDDQNRT